MHAAAAYADDMPNTPTNTAGRVVDEDTTSDERTYALFMHFSVLGHLVLPLLAAIIPAAMWAVKRDDSPFLDDHGREAFNFHMSLIIYHLVLIPVVILTLGIGAILYVALNALALVGMIFAVNAASRGEYYRYPMTLRFLH